MKTTLLIFLFIAFWCSATFAQGTSQEWQAKAVQKYPELGIGGSAFNKRFVGVYNERRKTAPEFFNNPQWPLKLADELATPTPTESTPQPVRSPFQATPRSQLEPVRATSQPSKTTLSPKPTPQATSSFHIETTHLVIAGVVGLIIILVMARSGNAQRRKKLLEKYGNPKIVDMIMRRMFWTGQTLEQLVDSLGHPADIDQKVLKSKVRETWKYNRTGRNRFGLRITVEDGIVVGWDQK